MSYRSRRAIGVCLNQDCEDFVKSVFLMNHGPRFYCPRCRSEGETVEEENRHWGEEGAPWARSEVEYNWCPIEKRYREIAIVQDTAIDSPFRTHRLMSPLIKTEKRGLKVAEALLANLRWFETPRTTEQIISMDSEPEEYQKALAAVFGKRIIG